MAATTPIIAAEQLAEGFYALHDPLGFRCYLVVGSRQAALVDAMGGLGNVRQRAEELAGGLPVRVLLTHHHVDHVTGALWFDEAGVPENERIDWDAIRSQAESHKADAVASGLVAPDAPLAGALCTRPCETMVCEGDCLDLGGRRLEAVALPGHTAGSMGYLCPELDVLLSGDAVTPIMCLCFDESLSVDEWQATLRKMEQLPFSRFYTGHHEAPFAKADLAGWSAAGDFAKTDRGFEWHHSFIEGWQGTCHLCPCPTFDADSPDFRAVITYGLPPRRTRTGSRGSARTS